MVAGAGTDYAVFLISRYHEELRAGADSDAAVIAALGTVGKVIAASAATVAVTFLCMSFAKLGLLSTVGPPLAITVGIAMLAAFTLLPAILVLAGRRGWVNPRRELTTNLWHRFGERLVRRPGEVPRGQPGHSGHSGGLRPVRAVRLGREQELARRRCPATRGMPPWARISR